MLIGAPNLGGGGEETLRIEVPAAVMARASDVIR